MRFKELPAPVVIALLVLLSHGYSNADTMNIYIPVIEKAADIISGALPPDYNDGWVGFSSIACNDEEGEPDQMMREIGYTMMNINGDNVLIIGMIDGHFLNGSGNMIVAMYNIHDGKPVNIIDGTTRDSWYMMNPGDSFLEYGSAGAACSICANYRYMPGHKPPLVCDRYNFTGINDAGDYLFYQSSIPTIDPAKAKKLDWTWDDWNLMVDNQAAQTMYIQLTPFEVLRPVTALQDADRVNFTSSTDVKDFKVWRLSDVNYTDEGKLTYSKTLMDGCDQLNALHNFNVLMPFQGDIPQYAISYVDMFGYPVLKSVEISGIDGNVQLLNLQ